MKAALYIPAGILVAASTLMQLGALNWTVQWYRPGGAKNIGQIARQLAAWVLGKSPRT